MVNAKQIPAPSGSSDSKVAAPTASSSNREAEASMTVAELDESELLSRIFPHLPTNDSVLLGPGDDCATVAAPQGSFVVSTDILIENVHFRTDWSSGYQVGWRAAMQNLADIAAMGARPTSLVIGLGLPKTTRVVWVTEFARGLGDAARSVGAACVGGDLSSASALFVSVTVHGDPVTEPVVRSGAKPGNVLAVAGHTGWSAAGLELLMQDQKGSLNSDCENVALALQTFRAPTSPISLGEAAARAGATAMMDISDGLLRDTQRLCKASGVTAIIDYSAVVSELEPPRPNHELQGLGQGLGPGYGRQKGPEQEQNQLQEQGETDKEPEGCSVCGSALVAELDGNSSSAERLVALARHLTSGNSSDEQSLVAKWLLTGGEDHGLLAAFPDQASVPDGFHVVGVLGSVGDGITSAYLAEPDNPDVPQTQESEAGMPSAGKNLKQGPATQFGAVQVLGVSISDSLVGWDHFR